MIRTICRMLIPLTAVSAFFLLQSLTVSLPPSYTLPVNTDHLSFQVPENPMDTPGLEEVLNVSGPSCRTTGSDIFNLYGIPGIDPGTGIDVRFTRYRLDVLIRIPGIHDVGLLFPFHYFW